MSMKVHSNSPFAGLPQLSVNSFTVALGAAVTYVALKALAFIVPCSIVFAPIASLAGCVAVIGVAVGVAAFLVAIAANVINGSKVSSRSSGAL